MAKLTFSQSYTNWTPGLLGRFDRDDLSIHNDKTIKFIIPGDYDDPQEIQGWSVTYKAAKGQKFGYSPGDEGFDEAVSGRVGSVEVRDENNALVMKITGITGVDIGDIFPYIVNINQDGGPNGDQKTVMEYLMRGNDTYTGTNGDNSFNVHDDYGNDKFIGKGGGDYFEVGAGNDTVDGGDDFDHFSYQNSMWSQNARQGAVFTLKSGNGVESTAIDPWGDKDTFKNIEQVSGSRFADTINGHLADDTWFFGVQGRRGADTFNLDKSDHIYVVYSEDRWDGGHRGIIADLGKTHNGPGDVKGTIRDGFGFIDKTIDVRKVEGTQYDDSFKGSRLDDHFSGLQGHDTYNGGAGTDWIQFDAVDRFGDDSPHGVNVDLTQAQGILDDGFGNTETTISIEAVIGSTFEDVIKGNNGKNTIVGEMGNDTLTGGGAADIFLYGVYHGDGYGDFGDTITDFTSGTDKFYFDSSRIGGLDDVVRFRMGSSANSKNGDSQFFFNADDHTLYLDTNGKANGGVHMVAVLDGVDSMTANDIKIVDHYLEIA